MAYIIDNLLVNWMKCSFFLGCIADSIYMVKVEFENEGKTNWFKNLKLYNGFLAEAEIITRKRSLLCKLFSCVVSWFNNE